MKIGIDARLIEETGVGRYIRNLTAELARIDTQNEYVIFLRKKSFDAYVLPNTRWTKKLAEVPWHTMSEQIVIPKLLRDARVDVVHIPYHNPPILYSGAMVITIHDLTILHFNTGKATTLPPILYALKRFGYWVELAVGLRRAKSIIAVSETTKRELMDHFGIAERKIHVTYEGVDEKIIAESKKNTKSASNGEYFLYVGNAYPHKNLDTFLDGFAKYSGSTKLVMVGKDDFFYHRLREKVKALQLDERVSFFGGANDDELHNLYRNAKMLIFPSRMEGFGLPALEAIALGTPVLCSDIPIFHEILGASATYMDSTSIDAIASALHNADETKTKSRIDAEVLLAKYNWKNMAEETKKIYENSICI